MRGKPPLVGMRGKPALVILWDQGELPYLSITIEICSPLGIKASNEGQATSRQAMRGKPPLFGWGSSHLLLVYGTKATYQSIALKYIYIQYSPSKLFVDYFWNTGLTQTIQLRESRQVTCSWLFKHWYPQTTTHSNIQILTFTEWKRKQFSW